VCPFTSLLPIEEVWRRADAALRAAKMLKPGEICYAKSDHVILPIDDVGPADFTKLLKEIVPEDASYLFESSDELLIDPKAERL